MDKTILIKAMREKRVREELVRKCENLVVEMKIRLRAERVIGKEF